MTGNRDASVRVIAGKRAMDECGPLWTTLAERLDVPVFQGPAWARTWLEHLGGHAEPWIVVCEGPDPFVWPLAVTR